MTAADVVLILCTLAPCVSSGDIIQIPVLEVPDRTWIEMMTRHDVDGIRVMFVPPSKGA